ncbi:MAG: imidazoleglycerol-phosphate dehydratase [Methanosaeta sp. PtaB.Bin039]|nr:MAG: imidazoleglycerol-phosphate dehydratase [Methanosaeta sp. PtaB.Bin039]OPY47663.1 MAG: imidazoleglycerol-phosphate dehydratase [Methanosaeta sp. PtaU1.Bin028]HOT06736.1 imidazoleglycerol-phosphate dehydratase [Methanotrichaceae archaeon]HQF16386.1 imidazoleglycerol-phosphate dehydratase [Methanotrichaceae archaeon]HQI91000.1 imidazoleglycerol-phosphate dehydratase [Methanotrichaceae archaeon]
MRSGRAEVERGGSVAEVALDLDGSGQVSLESGSGFLDHMMHSLARVGSLDLQASARGSSAWRCQVLGLGLGQALDQALGSRSGIRRYGWAAVPMDEALAQVALDLSGRPYLVIRGGLSGDMVADMEAGGLRQFLEALTVGGRLTMNLQLTGENDHHIVESAFKALGLALWQAAGPGKGGVLSTKGVL